MEPRVLRVLVSLGVPGVALGIFYLLFRTFNWSFPQVPEAWVGPAVVLFMVLTFAIVFYALTLWRPRPHEPVSESKPGGKPKVEIEGPPSAPLGKTTYFRIITENVVRVKWSIGGFQNEPVVVEPVGPVHEIYVEPTDKARVKHQFQIVVDAYSSDGSSARATRTFMVVAR
jgi:hypothetical protein